MSAEKRRNPSDFFKAALGRPVVVRLTTGADYHGVLAVVDGFMNIGACFSPLTQRARKQTHNSSSSSQKKAMEQTEEYVNGQLKATYGDTFIRGNNGLPKLKINNLKKKHILTL